MDSRTEFERMERTYHPESNLRKRRKKTLPPGVGRYFDDEVNKRWLTWQTCWDFLMKRSL